MGSGAKVMIFAYTGARGKGECDEGVVSEGGSLQGNKGSELIWTGRGADVNGPGWGHRRGCWIIWRWRERGRRGTEEHTNMRNKLVLAEGRGVETCVNLDLADGLKSVFPVKGQAGRTGNEENGEIQGAGTGNAPIQENRGRPPALLRRRGHQGSEIWGTRESVSKPSCALPVSAGDESLQRF